MQTEILISFPFSITMQFFILLSCSLAVFYNISQYLCIGRFSAVSFQVLGHMKTVCVVALGWLLFDLEMKAKNIIGMLLAVIGMIVYSWAVEADKQAASAKSLPSMKEEDMKLLLNEETEHSLLKDVESGVSRG